MPKLAKRSSQSEKSRSKCLFTPVFPFDPSQKKKIPQLSSQADGFAPLPSDWVAEFEVFPSADGKEQLFAYQLRQRDAKLPTGRALVVLHGQGEHGGRYLHWPHYLKDTVSAIYILEHRGHGHSTGGRGHVDYFDQYADDAALAIERYHNYLNERFEDAKVHLLGHSMGGLIALRTVLEHGNLPVKTLAVSNPMIELAFPVPPLKLMAGRLMHKILPSVPMASPSLWDKVSSDPSVASHYKNDALNHSYTSPAFFFSYLEAKDDLLKRCAEITLPVMVQSGLDDRIISPDSIKDLYDKLTGSKSRKFKAYKDLYHEIYNEPQRASVFADLCDWIANTK
jgi:alpha-beta hydrolase superfamily lysophospholipase